MFRKLLIKSIRLGINGISWDAEKACAGALEDVLKIAHNHNTNVELGFPPEIAIGKRIASPVEILRFPPVIKNIKEIVQLVRIVTAHLPMIDIASLDEYERRRNVDIQIEVMRAAYCLGVKQFVLHPAAGKVKYSWFASKAKKEAILKARHKASEQSVREIVEALDAYPIVIAIENLTAKEGDWSIKQLSYPFGKHRRLFLGICFDTLHEYSVGCKTLEQFTNIIDGWGEYLVEIHLNNGDGKENRLSKNVPHWPLTAGTVPVEEIIRYLQSKGFLPPVVIEVDSAQDWAASIELIRRTQASFLIWKKNAEGWLG